MQVFFEPFDKPWEGRWIPSENENYQGKWKHEKNDAYDDYGLLVSEKARKYGIAVELPEVHFKDDPLVLQYDLKTQNELGCGGAYLKYVMPQNAGWDPKHFDDKTTYSIMFGPDKCGATNKVHFIFRHKNPKTNKYVEHHLKYPPLPVFDKVTHVYTAIIFPNNTLKILIDGEEKRTGNLLSDDFDPPVPPPKTIPDLDDKKPKDWDEHPKLPDPEAKRSDDWDEDAPMEIEDLEAKKPEGWLDDEPEEIDDAKSTKPNNWVDDEDGKWNATKIPNPKCKEVPGCGEWKRPLKRNPNYKGKWHPPMIDNPHYKGSWKPHNIPNPEYCELDCPNLEGIAAIGIDIWTMQDGLLFDNILLASDVLVAQEYRDKYWKPKFEVEKEKQKAEEEADAYIPEFLAGIKAKVFDFLYKIADIPFLAPYKGQIIDLIREGERAPNLTIGIFVSLVVIVLTFIYRITTFIYKILFEGKKTASSPLDSRQRSSFHNNRNEVESSKNTADNDEDISRDIKREQQGTSGTRHRSIRREN